MKRLLVGTALALFGLAPAIGSACEYNDASMASSEPAAKLGLATQQGSCARRGEGGDRPHGNARG